MNLIKQMILKKFEKHTVDQMNNKENIWDFYQCVQLADIYYKINGLKHMPNQKKIALNQLFSKLYTNDNKIKDVFRSINFTDHAYITRFLKEFRHVKIVQERKLNIYRIGIVAVNGAYYG